MKYSLTILFLGLLGMSLGQLNKTDSQGRKQGEWAKLYEGTRVYQYKGAFKNDKPVGTFTYYYKSSKVKAIIKHGEGTGRSVAYYYHENGTVMSYGIYKNQLKDSIWVNFTDKKQVTSTETFLKGELHGQRVVYYLPKTPGDKSKRPSEFFNYKNGQLDGEFKSYHKNGKIKVHGHYLMNKRNGAWKEYHVEGNLMSLTRYKNGVRHGWCSAHDQSGKEVGRKYFYYGRLLEGAKLKRKMQQMKELGISPNG